MKKRQMNKILRIIQDGGDCKERTFKVALDKRMKKLKKDLKKRPHIGI